MNYNSMQNMIAEMRNYADIAATNSITVTNAPTLIRSWADRLASFLHLDEPIGEFRGYGGITGNPYVRLFERLTAGTMLYAAPQPSAAPSMREGWKLVPMEPTAEIMAGAAIATWPTASISDVALAMEAAEIVLRESMNLTPGTTQQVLASAIATMAPAYRAMIAAAPQE